MSEIGSPLTPATHSWRGAKRFVPHRVVRALLAETLTSPFESQRDPPPRTRSFEAAVLFLDVSGFTTLFEEAEANAGEEGMEEFTTVISQVFSVMIDRVLLHGGDVDCFCGDALLCVFEVQPGMTLAHAAVSATLCGMSVAEALTEGELAHFMLDIHSAVAAGTLISLDVGSLRRQEALIVGSAMDDLLMAHSLSQRSECIVSADAWRHLSKYCEGELREEGCVLIQGFSHQDLPRLTPSARPPPLPVTLSPGGNSIVTPNTVCDSAISTPKKKDANEEEWSQAMSPIPYDLFEPPPERMEWAQAQLDPYIPDQALRYGLRGKYLGGHATVSIAFVYYSGLFSTSMSEAEMGDRIQRACRIGMETVSERGGCLRQVACDDKGLVLIFCFGVAGCIFEDGASRAVQTALTISERTRGALDVLCGVGIATGGAFAGLVGDPEIRCEYAIVGDVVNLAARLANKALKDVRGVDADAKKSGDESGADGDDELASGQSPARKSSKGRKLMLSITVPTTSVPSSAASSPPKQSVVLCCDTTCKTSRHDNIDFTRRDDEFKAKGRDQGITIHVANFATKWNGDAGSFTRSSILGEGALSCSSIVSGLNVSSPNSNSRRFSTQAFVGRDDEILLFRNCLHRASRGQQPGWIVLSGEIGMGKSWIIDKFAAIAQSEKCFVVFDKALSDSRVPFEGISRALLQIFNELASRPVLSPNKRGTRKGKKSSTDHKTDLPGGPATSGQEGAMPIPVKGGGGGVGELSSPLQDNNSNNNNNGLKGSPSATSGGISMSPSRSSPKDRLNFFLRKGTKKANGSPTSSAGAGGGHAGVDFGAGGAGGAGNSNTLMGTSPSMSIPLPLVGGGNNSADKSLASRSPGHKFGTSPKDKMSSWIRKTFNKRRGSGGNGGGGMDVHSQRQLQLNSVVSGCGIPVEEAADLLNSVLPAANDGTGTLATSPPPRAALDDRLIMVLVHMLAKLSVAKVGKVVLLLEDVQFLGVAAWNFLTAVLHRLPNVCAVLTSRQMDLVEPEIAMHPAVDNLELSPLTESETHALSRSILGDRVATDVTLDELWERSRGNPFFCCELCLSYLAQQNANTGPGSGGSIRTRRGSLALPGAGGFGGDNDGTPGTPNSGSGVGLAGRRPSNLNISSPATDDTPGSGRSSHSRRASVSALSVAERQSIAMGEPMSFSPRPGFKAGLQAPMTPRASGAGPMTPRASSGSGLQRLPISLSGVIACRIDRLPANARLYLSVASVLGMQFRTEHCLALLKAIKRGDAENREDERLSSLAVGADAVIDDPGSAINILISAGLILAVPSTDVGKNDRAAEPLTPLTQVSQLSATPSHVTTPVAEGRSSPSGMSTGEGSPASLGAPFEMDDVDYTLKSPLGSGRQRSGSTHSVQENEPWPSVEHAEQDGAEGSNSGSTSVTGSQPHTPSTRSRKSSLTERVSGGDPRQRSATEGSGSCGLGASGSGSLGWGASGSMNSDGSPRRRVGLSHQRGGAWPSERVNGQHPPATAYMFAHTLYRECVYGMMLRVSCRTLHRSHAQYLAQQQPAELMRESDLVDLARHWFDALSGEDFPDPDDASDAIKVLALVASSAPVSAMDWYSEGLRLLEHLPEGPDRDRSELDFLCRWLPSLSYHSLTETFSEEDCELMEDILEEGASRAQALCKLLGQEQSVSTIQILLSRAWSEMSKGSFRSSLAQLQSVLAMKIDDVLVDVEIAAVGVTVLGHVGMHTDSSKFAEQTLAAWVKAGSPPPVHKIVFANPIAWLRVHGRLQPMIHRMDPPAVYNQELSSLLEELRAGDPSVAAHCFGYMGHLLALADGARGGPLLSLSLQLQNEGIAAYKRVCFEGGAFTRWRRFVQNVQFAASSANSAFGTDVRSQIGTRVIHEFKDPKDGSTTIVPPAASAALSSMVELVVQDSSYLMLAIGAAVALRCRDLPSLDTIMQLWRARLHPELCSYRGPDNALWRVGADVDGAPSSDSDVPDSNFSLTSALRGGSPRTPEPTSPGGGRFLKSLLNERKERHRSSSSTSAPDTDTDTGGASPDDAFGTFVGGGAGGAGGDVSTPSNRDVSPGHTRALRRLSPTGGGGDITPRTSLANFFAQISLPSGRTPTDTPREAPNRPQHAASTLGSTSSASGAPSDVDDLVLSAGRALPRSFADLDRVVQTTDRSPPQGPSPQGPSPRNSSSPAAGLLPAERGLRKCITHSPRITPRPSPKLGPKASPQDDAQENALPTAAAASSVIRPLQYFLPSEYWRIHGERLALAKQLNVEVNGRAFAPTGDTHGEEDALKILRYADRIAQQSCSKLLQSRARISLVQALMGNDVADMAEAQSLLSQMEDGKKPSLPMLLRTGVQETRIEETGCPVPSVRLSQPPMKHSLSLTHMELPGPRATLSTSGGSPVKTADIAMRQISVPGHIGDDSSQPSGSLPSSYNGKAVTLNAAHSATTTSEGAGGIGGVGGSGSHGGAMAILGPAHPVKSPTAIGGTVTSFSRDDSAQQRRIGRPPLLSSRQMSLSNMHVASSTSDIGSHVSRVNTNPWLFDEWALKGESDDIHSLKVLTGLKPSPTSMSSHSGPVHSTSVSVAASVSVATPSGAFDVSPSGGQLVATGTTPTPSLLLPPTPPPAQQSHNDEFVLNLPLSALNQQAAPSWLVPSQHAQGVDHGGVSKFSPSHVYPTNTPPENLGGPSRQIPGLSPTHQSNMNANVQQLFGSPSQCASFGSSSPAGASLVFCSPTGPMETIDDDGGPLVQEQGGDYLDPVPPALISPAHLDGAQQSLSGGVQISLVSPAGDAQPSLVSPAGDAQPSLVSQAGGMDLEDITTSMESKASRLSSLGPDADDLVLE